MSFEIWRGNLDSMSRSSSSLPLNSLVASLDEASIDNINDSTLIESNQNITVSCTLVNNAFAIFVQLFLACVVVATLYFKWIFEPNPRPRRIWMFDSLKQGIGAGTGHLINVGMAVFLSDVGEGNECAWYFFNSTSDAVFGVPLSYTLLKLFQRTLFQDGPKHAAYYNDLTMQVNFRVWLKQVICWICVVLTTKTLLAIPFCLLYKDISRLGQAMFSPFGQHPKFVLIFVMLIWPTVCNIIQWWIVSDFLRHREAVGSTRQDYHYRTVAEYGTDGSDENEERIAPCPSDTLDPPDVEFSG